jgi:sugar phosphate isomerase/epimerase
MAETPLPYRFAMFTKHLQSWPLAKSAQAIAGLGFQGADLTVRPGGYVEADKVKTDLAPALRTLHDWGLTAPLLTTAITSASDPNARATFELAAEHGVRELKLGYWAYKDFGTLKASAEACAKDLDGIEKLAQSTGVRANLHTHSEGQLTALAPLVWWLIKDRDPKTIGAYVDPGHMCVEGGGEGWRMGLDLLAGRVNLVAIKDLRWEAVETPAGWNKPRWQSKVVPLNEGIVPWPKVFSCFQATNYGGWMSMHAEYQGWRSWKELSVEQVLEQTKQDLAYLRSILVKTG